MIKALLYCALLCEFTANAQLLIDTVAGGKIQSGVSAQDVPIRTSGTFTKDAAGNLVFATAYILQSIGTDGIIRTIAGTRESGYSGDGGPAVQASLSSPYNPRYDKAGNLYFVDGYRIRRVDTKGIITTVVGTGIQGRLGADGPAASAQIDSVYGMELDSAGNLYFEESDEIRRLTTDRRLEVFAKTGGGTMTMDPSGNIYLFLGQGGEDVYRITPDGSSSLIAGYSLTGNSSLRRLQTTGATTDSAGNVYVLTEDLSTGGGFNIWRITPDASLTEYLTHVVAESGAGYQLTAIGPSENGSLYFADSGYRIQLFTSPMTVQTIGGQNAFNTPDPDGTPAREAWFFSPQQITVSRPGNLYIQDGCTIREAGSDGLLETVASGSPCPVAMAVDSGSRIFTFGTDYSGAKTVRGIFIRNPGGDASLIPEIAAVEGTLGGVSLAVDSKDRLYILPTAASTRPGLVRWSSTGGVEILDWDQSLPSTNVPSYQKAAPYLAIDASDNVYLDDRTSGDMYRFSPDGTSTVVAHFPAMPVPLTSIGPFAVDTSGHIWTSVPYPHRTYTTLSGAGLLSMSGVTEVAPCCGYSGNGGSPVSARTGSYTSIAASPTGGIYMLNPTLQLVRKISGTIPVDRPVISAAGIVNAASLQGGALAPGELISIFGSNFGQNAVHSYVPDNNSVPSSLGNLAVFFNGVRGAITATAPNQVNVFVPYEAAGAQNVSITVMVDGAVSDPVSIPVATTAFGISTANASGSGQGAVLNQDGSYNSSSNPAPVGSVISLFGTGEGLTTPALPDGALVISTPFSAPAGPVTVTIGGQAATVTYAGAAPFLPTGVLQINAQIPAGVPAGDAEVVVSLAGVATTRQVTCAVK